MTRKDAVLALFAEANPVPDLRTYARQTESSAPLETPEQWRDPMEDTRLKSAEPAADSPRRRNWPIIGVAAAAVVLIVGLGVWTLLTANESEPAAPSTREEFGEAMLTAFDSHDGDAAVTLLGTDPDIDVFGTDTPDELRDLAGWFEAVEWRFDSQGCTTSGAEQVTCGVRQRNEWSEAVQFEPVFAQLRLDVADGQITKVEYEFDFSAWSPNVFEPFANFVVANHPGDVQTMWRIEDGFAPKLTEDALALFDQYSAEYAEAVAGG